MFYATFEKALNEVCTLNPYADNCLQRLSGKTIVIALTLPSIALTLPSIAFSLQFDSNSIHLSPDEQSNYDLRLAGSAPTFMMMQLNPNKDNISQLQADGEFALAHDLNQLLSYANIDWPELFSRFVGDIASQEMFKCASQALSYKNELGHTALKNTTEYLQEELRLLPTIAEANQFFQDIDSLRDDVERAALSLKQAQSGN